MSKDSKIIYKTVQQIENIRDSWKYLTELLWLLREKVWVWVALVELEDFAEAYIQKRNLKWAFKWYQWFPANLCLSVNDCVVHGIPNRYVLKNWDLIKVDCGITYKWWISDSAFSVLVGWEMTDPIWYKLIKVTKDALDLALEYVKPWKSVYDYSREISRYMKQNWFNIIQNLTGHGVWVKVHEAPHIYNYPHPDTKYMKFKANMVVALEPITSLSSNDTIYKNWNDWNLYTKNWDLGAQWEYTILITEKGNEVLAWLRDFV